MTITTASDTIPQPLLDLLTANSLQLIDPDELATLPAGPFTATSLRQDGDVVAGDLGGGRVGGAGRGSMSSNARTGYREDAVIDRTGRTPNPNSIVSQRASTR